MTTDQESRALDDVVTRLSEKFPHLEPDEIRGEVTSRFDTFDDAPVRDFVPLLIEREATEAIRGRRQPAVD